MPLGVISAAVLICGFANASHAAGGFGDITIEIDEPVWTTAHQQAAATVATNWIELETISARSSAAQNAGMLGFDKPVMTLPDGSTATLNLGARAGAIRAGITWNMN
jgi:hypothetical protein